MRVRVIAFLHQLFNRLLIPMVVGGLWCYATLERQSIDNMTVTWQEGDVTVTGNPFKMPGRPPAIVYDADLPAPDANFPLVSPADAQATTNGDLFP